MIYHAREGQYSAGEPIGILLLDALLPLPPGDVAHAATYPFPVRFHVVKAASIDRLIYQRDPALLQPFIDGAQALVAQGVRAVTSDCGFMALFQKEIAAAVPVPVFLSSLLQVPFIHHTLTPGEAVGIITADKAQLTPRHLRAVGITPDMPVVIGGMEEQPHFHDAILDEQGTLDFKQVENEVVSVARSMVETTPHIQSILLECSNLPPYASAVQQATNRPVYDFITMIHHVHHALIRHPYQNPVQM